MKIRNLIILATVLIMGWQDAYAQHRGECGTTYEMEQQLPVYSQKEVDTFKEAHPERFAKINIPITFHLVADFDGEGRIAKKYVLNMLCRLNYDYADYGIGFYLKDSGFNNIDNTGIFNFPGNNGSLLVANKDGASVDVFITQNADTQGGIGTTLGYYSPGGDYVVIRQQEVVDSSNTISHELGHYFSLRHPHSGWNEPYDIETYGDTLPFFTVPETGAAVELMDGSNCSTAADQLCDTAPDYLLGFTNNSCSNIFGVYDPNEDLLVSDPRLSMGYFSNCPTYRFSPQQVDRMKMNIASPGRNFLDNNESPNEDDVTGDLTITSPSQSGQTFDNYNGVELSWEGVENADHYLVEISNAANAGDFIEIITSETAVYVTDLDPDQGYFLNIKPFNQANGCYPEKTTVFFTGEETTSTVDPDFVKSFNIYPNPAQADQDLQIEMNSEWSGTAELRITSLTGQQVYARDVDILADQQWIDVKQNNAISSGVYILTMATEAGSITRKIIIQ